MIIKCKVSEEKFLEREMLIVRIKIIFLIVLYLIIIF